MATRYHAYISYNHQDVRFAVWLQGTIETYRIPTRIENEKGITRLSPVFRDRSDLHSSPNLGRALEAAIENSDALVVVCSKDAAKSHWVNEEIECFKRIHGNKRIFAIIARDDPPSCFPPALQRDSNNHPLEPVAADARRSGDGRRDALLKTIAALLNVEFDGLKRRELRRQYQRMTIAAVVSASVAIVTIVLALMAYDARNDANRRSAQAEDLISFMLGDLRSRLEPIGRLDVLDAVGDKSLEYFATLEEDELNNDMLLGRARALRQIGEVRFAQGNLARALEAFTMSNNQSNALKAKRYQPEKVEFELGQSHFWIGYVHYQQNDMAAARIQFEEYLQLSRNLLTYSPGNPAYRTELAYAHSNLGSLELAQNRFWEAQQHFTQTMAINESFAQAEPDSIDRQFNLAETLSWLGAVSAKSRPIAESVEWYEREFLLRKKIVSGSDSMAHVKKLADAALLLGHQKMLLNDTNSAHEQFEYARKLCVKLTKHDPENMIWKRLLAFARLAISRVLIIEGAMDTAAQQVQQAVSQMRQLRSLAPTDMDSLTDLLKATGQEARLKRIVGDNDAALAAVNDGLAYSSGQTANRNAILRGAVANLSLLKGDLLDAKDRHQEAIDAWNMALLQIIDLPIEFKEPLTLLTRAELHTRLENESEAAADRADLVRLGFSDSESKLTQALIDGIPR